MDNDNNVVQPEEEISEFEARVDEMLGKMEQQGYEFAFYFGKMIAQHSCIDNEMYTDEEALDIIRDFVIETNSNFVNNDYEVWLHTVRNCFARVVCKHHYPEELMDEAKIEMDAYTCLRRIDTNEEIFDEEAESGRYNPDDIKPLADDDMDTMDLATIFATIPYDCENEDFCDELGFSYDYEHHHMSQWFSTQITLGQGNYSRKVPNFSGRTTYNHLLDPNGFLWIATVMGIHEDLIRKAHHEMQAVKTFSAKCGIIRKIIPFDMILDQARDLLEELLQE